MFFTIVMMSITFYNQFNFCNLDFVLLTKSK